MNARLTPQEQRVVRSLWDGLDQQAVAEQLGLSRATVRHYLERARRRVGATSTIVLMRKAMAQGVLTP